MCYKHQPSSTACENNTTVTKITQIHCVAQMHRSLKFKYDSAYCYSWSLKLAILFDKRQSQDKAHVLRSLLSPLVRRVHIQLHCCTVTLPDISGHDWDMSRVLPVDTSLCSVSSAIVAQTLPFHDNLYTCGSQYSTSVLERDDNRQLRTTLISLQSVPFRRSQNYTLWPAVVLKASWYMGLYFKIQWKEKDKVPLDKT